MAENKEPLENKDNPSSPASGGNDDWKAKYEALDKEHNVVVQQRNMFKNQVEDRDNQIKELSGKLDTSNAELDRLKAEADKTAKQSAIDKKQSEVLAKFKPETRELAKELGLELSDPEDEKAIETFEAKLQKLESTAPSTDSGDGKPKPKSPPVGGNNRRLDDSPPPKPKTEEDLVKETEARIAAGEFDNVKL